MAESNTFPFVPQSQFVDIPEGPLVGDLWEGELLNERVTRGLIAKVTEVSQITEVTIAANNPGDTVGVVIDGGTIEVTAGANAGATALLLKAKIEAAAFLSGKLSSVPVDGAKVTINFADYVEHTVEEYSPDATTATPDTTQDAVGQEKLLYGMGVVKKLPITTANNTCIAKPSSLNDVHAGVLVRTHGTNIPPEQIRVLGFDPDYLCPGYTYTVGMNNLGVVVKYFGTAPSVGDPVYEIMVGENAGHWRIDDGGTAKVVTITLTPAVGDAVGFSYNGLPPLTVTGTASAATDAAGVYALFVANASYMALVDSIVDNADGTLTLEFKSGVNPTFADESTPDSVAAETVDTAYVAPTAVLRSQYSWGRPSITAGDPVRAFLRLSNP